MAVEVPLEVSHGGSPSSTLLLFVASAVLVLGSAFILYTRARERRGTVNSVRQLETLDSQGKKKLKQKKGQQGEGKEQEEEEEEETLVQIPVTVLYGSQTGTAEGYAKSVVKELKHKLGSKADVVLGDLDEFASSDDGYIAKLGSSESVSLLLMATYGDGEPTDNAARFCRCLARLAEEAEEAEEAAEGGAGKEPGTFRLLTYAVFGLGNRQYEHFNAVGKAVDAQLFALGGRRLMDLVMGDDDQCMEDDFEGWKQRALEAVAAEVEDRWQKVNHARLASKQQVLANGHHGQGDVAKVGEHLQNGFSANQNGETHHKGGEEVKEEEDDWSAAVQGLAVVFYEPGSTEAKGAAHSLEFFEGGEQWHGYKVTRVPVLVCRELHSSASPRSCLHLELDLSADPQTTSSAETGQSLGATEAQNGFHSAGEGSKSGEDTSRLPGSLWYTPGDHVAVFAQNEDADVQCAAELLGVGDKLASVFSLRALDTCPASAASLAAPFATPMRLDTALRCLVDLHSSPHKSALQLLAGHATDPEDARRLLHLASPQGREEYMEWVLKAHRSLLEVLRAFPSARPPLSVFLTALAPRLLPRFYSISSSLALCPGLLSVTCAVVDDVTPAGRAHHGVCSFNFKRIGMKLQGHGQNGTVPSSGIVPSGAPRVSVPIFLRPSSFRLPPSSATPLILIGPGTGVAPFRGFLQERQAALEKSKNRQLAGAALGPAVMFFGCRSKSQDFIYEKELEGWRETGVLSALHVAFSREGPNKVYVQHLLAQQSSLIWRLWFVEGGYLYVCGDAKHMARDVHGTLVKIAQEQGKMALDEAESMIKKMQHDNRYQRDVW